MLNAMRDNLKHLKYVLWLVALSMLFYLGSYFDRGLRSRGSADWAARVDGTTISQQEFIRIARDRDEYYRNLFGQQYDQMKKRLQLGTQAVQALVDRELVLGQARALGLEATPEEISQAIMDQPNFKTPQGTFVGKEQYVAAVENSVDGGVPAYEKQLADSILTRKWLALMTASAAISDAELESAWRTRNERAAFDYVYVPVASVNFDTAVSDAATSAWYESHKTSYVRPETRRLKVLVVDRQSQVASVQVSDDDVRKEYDAHRDEYQRPEQRHVRHILFKLPSSGSDADKKSLHDLAASVLARAQKGEDFAALARSMSQDTASAAKGGDLGWFGRGAMVKPFDDAAFSTAPGQFAPVVETEYGFHVLQVLEERPAGAVAFDEVKDNLKRRLQLQRAQDAAVAAAQKIRSEVTSPATLDAAAAKAGLRAEETRYSAEDAALDLGPSPEFGAAVSTLAAGQVAGPVGVARGMAIVACVEVMPAAPHALAEVAARVKTDLLNDRGRAAALAAARAVAASPTLASGAKDKKLEVKSSGEVPRGSALPGVGVSPDLDGAVFGASTTVGSKGAVATAGGAVAYAVTKHDTFDAARFATEKGALREEILDQKRNEMLQSIIDALRQKHVVEINQALIDSVNG